MRDGRRQATHCHATNEWVDEVLGQQELRTHEVGERETGGGSQRAEQVALDEQRIANVEQRREAHVEQQREAHVEQQREADDQAAGRLERIDREAPDELGQFGQAEHAEPRLIERERAKHGERVDR